MDNLCEIEKSKLANFDNLERYIVDQNDEFTILMIPKGLIEFDRELILSLYKDAILTHSREHPYQTKIKLIHK
jgi:hypothetical protein